MGRHRANPEKTQAEALHRQAIQALTAGRLKDGISLLKQALTADPKFAPALQDLGTAYWQSGRPALAEKAYAKAFQVDSGNPYILNTYGAFLLEQYRLEEADPLLARAYALKPDHYEIANNFGLLRFRQGRLAEAEGLLLKAIALNPAWPNAHANLGSVLAGTGRFEPAEKACRQAIQLHPHHALAWSQLGEICAHLERDKEAFACIRKAIALAPSEALSWLRLLDLLEKKTMLEEVEDVIKQAKSHSIEAPGIVLAELRMLRRRGRMTEAAAIAEKHRERLKTARPRPSIYAFFFEAGQIYDRLNETDKAFECFTIANGMQRLLEGTGGDTGEIRRDTLRPLTAFTPALARPSCAPPEDSRAPPVFLVGFPRSGTTLLDQILTSHPAIEVAEEKAAVDQAMSRFAEIFGGAPRAAMPEAAEIAWYLHEPCYPAALSKLRTSDIAELRDVFYQAHEWPAQNPDKRILIDKLPLNLLFAGFIKRVFPEAKFILALRHPCDSVLSCYMQKFQLNPYMARFLDLKDGAQFYDEAFRLWNHYTSVCDLNVHTVRYEDVVADFRPAVGGLLEFLGAGWNDAVLQYDETAKKRKRIATPSYHQVTEKIYTRASGRWLRYRKHMEPVLDILAPHAASHGYSMESIDEEKIAPINEEK